MEYDEIVEDEGSPYVVEHEQAASSWSWAMVNPFTFLLTTLEQYGWIIVFGGLAAAYLVSWISKNTNWFKSDEDAEYKKDPDSALARMEAVQRARELQQQRLEEASRRAIQLQKERAERKREEALERLQKYKATAGRKLGSLDDGYLPLSGDASTSSYRPPKKSKCGGGGCGR